MKIIAMKLKNHHDNYQGFVHIFNNHPRLMSTHNIKNISGSSYNPSTLKHKLKQMHFSYYNALTINHVKTKTWKMLKPCNMVIWFDCKMKLIAT
jgi:hypothetical protein